MLPGRPSASSSPAAGSVSAGQRDAGRPGVATGRQRLDRRRRQGVDPGVTPDRRRQHHVGMPGGDRPGQRRIAFASLGEDDVEGHHARTRPAQPLEQPRMHVARVRPRPEARQQRAQRGIVEVDHQHVVEGRRPRRLAQHAVVDRLRQRLVQRQPAQCQRQQQRGQRHPQQAAHGYSPTTSSRPSGSSSHHFDSGTSIACGVLQGPSRPSDSIVFRRRK